jgi:serine/threonine-protein kinase
LYKLLDYINQVLMALGYAHENGVVHRDIKPSNIMITPQGSVKLMDFGIAKSNLEPLLTQPGTTIGSLLYMSPEQVRGTAVDARSDLYSVGIVLYELAAGRRPFEAESTYAVLEAQLNTPPAPPVEVNPSVPKPLNDIILTALEKDPSLRFQKAAAFQKALESVIAGGAADKTRFVASAVQQTPAPAPIAATRQTAAAAAPAALPGIAIQPAAKGKRSLWMAAGAIACLCVLAAAVVAVPHFRKSSAASNPAGTGGQLPLTGSAITTPPATGPISTAPVTDSSPQSVLKTGAISPITAPGLGESSSTAIVKRSRPEPKPHETASAKRQAPPPGPPPAPKPSGDTAKTAPTPQPGPSQEALNNASEALMKLNSRADAVRGSLTQLRQQQAQSGFGLRQDIAASASRLDSYLQMADRMLQAGNLELAQKNMDHAEEELTKLEKFFGR